MTEVYKGIKFPRPFHFFQDEYCKMANCSDVPCVECGYDSRNIEIFKDWKENEGEEDARDKD